MGVPLGKEVAEGICQLFFLIGLIPHDYRSVLHGVHSETQLEMVREGAAVRCTSEVGTTRRRSAVVLNLRFVDVFPSLVRRSFNACYLWIGTQQKKESGGQGKEGDDTQNEIPEQYPSLRSSTDCRRSLLRIEALATLRIISR